MAANVTEIDGHIPNYVDPETKVPLLLGIQISLTALALIVVALRLYTRKYIRKMLTTEDWVASASMASQPSRCLTVYQTFTDEARMKLTALSLFSLGPVLLFYLGLLPG